LGKPQRGYYDLFKIKIQLLLEIIVEMASYIEVPEAHLAEGRSYATILDQMDVSAEFSPLIEIHSDESKPNDDFVAVEYHDKN